jgi:hypothetical protein
MEKKLISALTGLAVLTLLVFFAGKMIFAAIPQYYFSMFPWLIVFMFALNAALFIFFFRSANKTDLQFIRAIMGSSGIKIIIYLLFIAVYVILNPGHAVAFSVSLISMYFLFTAYDLFIMLKAMKRKKEKKVTSNHFSN